MLAMNTIPISRRMPGPPYTEFAAPLTLPGEAGLRTRSASVLLAVRHHIPREGYAEGYVQGLAP